jgi:hypothetical protein
MNAKSAMIIAAIVFIFTGCASENIQVRKLPDSAINAGLEDRGRSGGQRCTGRMV